MFEEQEAMWLKHIIMGKSSERIQPETTCESPQVPLPLLIIQPTPRSIPQTFQQSNLHHSCPCPDPNAFLLITSTV